MEFLEPETYQPIARGLFDRLSAMIRDALPAAQVEHIGSSSIDGALSKGDLDIFVAVEQDDLEATIPVLERLGFRVKHDSLRTEALCPFESHDYPLDVGVQLVAKRSRFEFFLTFRDRMNRDPALRAEYNQLKHAAAPLSMEDYRKRKSEFIEAVLRRP